MTPESELVPYNGTLYEIDEQGRVWRIATGNRRIARRRAEHYLPCGYQRVFITIDGKRYRVMAHRLVWTVMNGHIPDGMEINHKDGRKDNNSPDNLECVTPAENVRHAHAILKIRKAVGERNACSKLTTQQVIAMRQDWPLLSYAKLGKKYEVNPWTARRIVKRKAWRHV